MGVSSAGVAQRDGSPSACVSACERSGLPRTGASRVVSSARDDRAGPFTPSCISARDTGLRRSRLYLRGFAVARDWVYVPQRRGLGFEDRFVIGPSAPAGANRFLGPRCEGALAGETVTRARRRGSPGVGEPPTLASRPAFARSWLRR